MDMAVLLDVALSPLTHLASSRIEREDAMDRSEQGKARVLPEAADAGDRRLLADVRGQGYHLVTVAADDAGPTYTFTVGLVYTFNHPEIVVFGKSEAAAQHFLTALVHAIGKGRRFAANETYPDALNGGAVAFLAVPVRHYRDYLGYAMWLYRSLDFPAIQALYPDGAGRFPTDPEAEEHFRALQPLLDRMA